MLAFFSKYAHQHLPCQKLTKLLPCVSSPDLQKLLTELSLVNEGKKSQRDMD